MVGGVVTGPDDRSFVERSRPVERYTPPHLAERILKTRSALEGERKQVTVIFCDIVGSTALAEAVGPEAMHALLNEFFEVVLDIVHGYEGTINQFLGDGVMAIFGAPISHEDHALRACLAALDLQAAFSLLRESKGDAGWEGLEVRIGVNSGFLVVGRIGNDLRMDYTAIGDTTNVAARLQSTAAPGEILISEATRRTVEGYIEYAALSPAVVKGKSQPVQIFRLTGRGSRRSPIEPIEGRPLATFLGRDEEMAVLTASLADARAGNGAVLSVVGDPGVGKSRLLHEFVQAERHDLTLVSGRCVSYGGSTSYLPVAEIVRTIAGVTEADGADEIIGGLRRTLDELGLTGPDDLPCLLALLGIPATGDELKSLDPATIKGRTFAIVKELILKLADRGPVLVSVEDLHWADPTSVELLSEFVASVATAPVLLVTTYRKGFVPWPDGGQERRLVLGPLSMEDSATLVVSGLQGRPVDDQVVSRIVQTGEGNPFFLEEMARELVDHGQLAVVPDSIQGVLAARIDRLPEPEKRLLQTASVLGREFSLVALDALWDEDVPVAPGVRDLATLEFLTAPRDAEPVYMFKHALVQEVAYDTLLTGRRQSLHTLAAESLEATARPAEEQCEALARHWSLSGEPARALPFLEMANRKAIRSHALEEAKAFLYEFLRLLDDQPDDEEHRRRRVTLLLEQFPVFHFTHGHQEYYELLIACEPTVMALADDRLRGAFMAEMGHRLWTFGEYDRALDLLDGAATLADRAGADDVALHAYVVLGWTHLMTGDFDRMIALQDLVADRLRTGYDATWRMQWYGGLGIAFTQLGRWDEAVAACMEGYAGGERTSDDGAMSFSATLASYTRCNQNDGAGALAFANLALEKAPTVYFRGFAQGFLAAALVCSGQPQVGVPILDAIMPFVRASRHESSWLLMAPLVAAGHMQLGDLESAERLLDDALGAANRSGARFVTGTTERLLAEIDLSRDPDDHEGQAAERFARAIATLEEIGAENELGLALAGYGRLAKNRGDDDTATDRLTRALEILNRLETLDEPDRIRRDLQDVERTS